MKFIVFCCLFIMSEAWLTKRIHGGIDAKLKEFPNIVSLQVLQNDTKEYEHFCAGIIVDELWILTSGYCVSCFNVTFPVNDVRIKAGIWTIFLNETTEQISTVALYFKHEQMRYSSTSRHFDIGLIKLVKKLEFNEYVRSLPIPIVERLYLEGLAVIVGWGRLKDESTSYFWSDGLQKLNVRLLNLLPCRTSIRNLVDKYWRKEDSDIIDESHICSGPLTGDEFICEGDIGGPLLQDRGRGWYVIGIISYTILPYGIRGSPMVYTNISFFTAWIKDIMEKN